LPFLLRRRVADFSDVPVVHAGVPALQLQSLAPLPHDVIGIPVDFAYARTIEQSLRLHPNATRLVWITGTLPWDRDNEAQLRAIVHRLGDRISVEPMAGLPTRSVLERVAELGTDAVVFTPGYLADGEGHRFTPYRSAQLIAEASNAPVYGPFSTFIGNGVVGGWTPSYVEIARNAATLVNALLAGVPVADVQVPRGTPVELRLDWRQVRRWGIPESLIPEGAVLEFKEPTFWEAYGHVALIGLGIIALQSALIIGMFLEHRRRRAAEHFVATQRLELAHASRLAMAGQLTASIAHEVNQPLGSILANADTGELILESDEDRRDELRAIFADIRRDDRRASEVIRRLRALLGKHEYERTPFRFNDVLRDLDSILRVEARQRDVELDIRPSSVDVMVVGDVVQIEQVFINLVLNAMDASHGLPAKRRLVTVSARLVDDRVTVDVRDRGTGISSEHFSRLFDSFFTTKPKGMGLGLSIARTLVETHGGRIWGENAPTGGAIFHVELPVQPSALAVTALASA
jgi:signal transduction histidine kinase